MIAKDRRNAAAAIFCESRHAPRWHRVRQLYAPGYGARRGQIVSEKCFPPIRLHAGVCRYVTMRAAARTADHHASSVPFDRHGVSFISIRTFIQPFDLVSAQPCASPPFFPLSGAEARAIKGYHRRHRLPAPKTSATDETLVALLHRFPAQSGKPGEAADIDHEASLLAFDILGVVPGIGKLMQRLP